MKIFILVFLFIAGGIWAGCQQKNIKLPSLSPPVVTPVINGYTNSGIQFTGSLELSIFSSGTEIDGDFHVLVNGAAVTNAAVTVFTPTSSYRMSWDGSYYYHDYYYGANVSPGSVYSVQVTTALGVASASCTLPGPMTISPDGFKVSWPPPASSGVVYVTHGCCIASDSSGVYSPYYLPVTTFAAGPGVYNYQIFTSRDSVDFVNAEPGSRFGLYWRNDTSITK